MAAERAEPVRETDEDQSARLRDAQHFMEHAPWIGYVFEDIRGERHID